MSDRRCDTAELLRRHFMPWRSDLLAGLPPEDVHRIVRASWTASLKGQAALSALGVSLFWGWMYAFGNGTDYVENRWDFNVLSGVFGGLLGIFAGLGAACAVAAWVPMTIHRWCVERRVRRARAETLCPVCLYEVAAVLEAGEKPCPECAFELTAFHANAENGRAHEP